MRSSRMRGYGAWCQGWREGERRRSSGPSGGPGLFFIGFMTLVVFSFLKVALETGNPLAFFLGLGIVAGVIKGLNS